MLIQTKALGRPAAVMSGCGVRYASMPDSVSMPGTGRVSEPAHILLVKDAMNKKTAE